MLQYTPKVTSLFKRSGSGNSTLRDNKHLSFYICTDYLKSKQSNVTPEFRGSELKGKYNILKVHQLHLFIK